MGGDAPLPSGPVTLSVANFGAKGDGVTDDTQAIVAAIAAINQGVLFFPPGKGEWG